MYPVGNLLIPAPHGQLEAIIKEPRGESASPQGVALVLHPHPLHGGTMHNKVVFRAARGLNEAGLITLRINFRSVGHSTGAHDHARGGEQEDARTALDYLTNAYPNLPVLLAGFSFGARVGLEVGSSDARVSRLIGIGTPIRLEADDFDFLRECRKPTLFVHGEHDEVSDVQRLREIAATLPPAAHARIEVIAGAGHFFDQQLEELTRVIKEWTEQQG